MAEKKEEYFVWEMSKRDRREPNRQVNEKPLSLERARKLAQTGAAKGTHDRAVTPRPTSARGWRIIAQYAAGTGKDVTIMYRRPPPGTPRRKRVPAPAHPAPPAPEELSELPEPPGELVFAPEA